jgi:hypothetical protein
MKVKYKLAILKIITAICIFIAVFFAYQLPAGGFQTIFKVTFLAISAICVVVISSHTSEQKNRLVNYLFLFFLVVTSVLFLLEY